MRLANMLDEALVSHRLTATTKKEAMEELLGLVQKKYPQYDYPAILKSILEREEVENTSYGRGIAFPHARTDAVDEMYVAVGVAPEGLTDRTSDEIPLRMICLMLTPSNIAKLYLQTLSAFAAFARKPENLDNVARATSVGGVIDAIWESGVTIEKELTAKDLMRHDVITVTPEDSLKRVSNLMFRWRLSALAVVDGQGKLLGQITDKELIAAAMPDLKSLIANLSNSQNVEPFEELLRREDKIFVSQLFTSDHTVVKCDTKIVEVAAIMLLKDLRRVFVVEEGKLMGIILRKDIVNTIIRG